MLQSIACHRQWHGAHFLFKYWLKKIRFLSYSEYSSGKRAKKLASATWYLLSRAEGLTIPVHRYIAANPVQVHWLWQSLCIS